DAGYDDVLQTVSLAGNDYVLDSRFGLREIGHPGSLDLSEEVTRPLRLIQYLPAPFFESEVVDAALIVKGKRAFLLCVELEPGYVYAHLWSRFNVDRSRNRVRRR